MQKPLPPKLAEICEETYRIMQGMYKVHPMLPGCEGVEDAFAEGSPCSQSYDRLYAAKAIILEWGQRHFEAQLECICREYEDICEYLAKAMFARGVYVGQHPELTEEA